MNETLPGTRATNTRLAELVTELAHDFAGCKIFAAQSHKETT